MVSSIHPYAPSKLSPSRDLSSNEMNKILNQFPSLIAPDVSLSDVKALFLPIEWVKVETLKHPELNISSNVPVGTLVRMLQLIAVIRGLDGDQITEMVIIYFEFLIGLFTNLVISFYKKKILNVGNCYDTWFKLVSIAPYWQIGGDK